jgi:hypothetical protein
MRGDRMSKKSTQRHRSDSKQQCPRCAEWVQAKAMICRFCGTSLGGGPATPLPLVPGPLPIYAERTPSAPPPPPPPKGATSRGRAERYGGRGSGSDATQTTMLIAGAAAAVVLLLVIASAATTQSQLTSLRQRMQQIEQQNQATRDRLREEESRRPCAWCKGAGRYQDGVCQACGGSGRFKAGAPGEAPLGAAPAPPPSPSTGGAREPKGLEGSGDTVYINSSGDHYHSAGCPELREGGMQIERRSAEAMRYAACPRCR